MAKKKFTAPVALTNGASDARNLTDELVADAMTTAIHLIDGARHERERAVAILILARDRLNEEIGVGKMGYLLTESEEES